LRAWQEAMDLVQEIYAATRTFSEWERFGLTAQIRRAAISVPSNIAEGAARETTSEFRQFLIVARGSLSELETQLILARNLGYLSEERFADLMARVDTVFALLGGLLRSFKQRSIP